MPARATGPQVQGRAGPEGAGTFCGRSGEPTAPLRLTGEPVPPCAPSALRGSPMGKKTACPTGCARPGYRAAGPGPRRPWSLPQERNSPGRLSQRQGLCFWHRPCRFVVGRQAAVLGSGVWVRMGAIAVM